MDVKQLVMLAVRTSIFLTVFGFGLNASSADLLFVLRRPGLLARSLLAVLVIMPLVVLALVKVLDFSRTVEVALVALSISPLPPILPRNETRARAHPSFALGLMAVLAILSIASVPLSLELIARLSGRTVGIAPGIVARAVVTSTLLPLAAGVLLRFALPSAADRVERYVTPTARLLLPLAVVALVAGAFSEMWSLIGNGTILAIVIFTVAGLGIGHVLGGPDPNHATVLALATACRHPAVAFFIAGVNVPDLRFEGIILLYIIVNAIVGIPYLKWQQRALQQVERVA